MELINSYFHRFASQLKSTLYQNPYILRTAVLSQPKAIPGTYHVLKKYLLNDSVDEWMNLYLTDIEIETRVTYLLE